MKTFKFNALILFILGFLCSWFYLNSGVKKFLIETNEPALKQKIDYDKVTFQNCAPRGENHGENWLGNDLTAALKKIYPSTTQLFQDEKIDDDSGINIYMRGYLQYAPPFLDDKHINLAYIFYPVFYSHYDKEKIAKRHLLKPVHDGYLQSFFDEMQFYDVLAVASKPYAEKMRKAGFKVYYVPQFTDVTRFYPDYDESVKSEVLFVGARPQDRKAPMIVYNHGLPITIYGPENNGISKAEFVDNDELHKYYSSAKIVLNDHRDDMKQDGFINNRTFDVTASGGFLISDYLPEIEEIYGDSIPMWKTEDELVELVKYYLDPAHEEERKEKAARAREITLKNFTADMVAERFKAIIDETKKEKGLK